MNETILYTLLDQSEFLQISNDDDDDYLTPDRKSIDVSFFKIINKIIKILRLMRIVLMLLSCN